MEKINFSVIACLTFCLALIAQMDFKNLSGFDYAVIASACVLAATAVARFMLASKKA